MPYLTLKARTASIIGVRLAIIVPTPTKECIVGQSPAGFSTPGIEIDALSALNLGASYTLRQIQTTITVPLF